MSAGLFSVAASSSAPVALITASSTAASFTSLYSASTFAVTCAFWLKHNTHQKGSATCAHNFSNLGQNSGGAALDFSNVPVYMSNVRFKERAIASLTSKGTSADMRGKSIANHSCRTHTSKSCAAGHLHVAWAQNFVSEHCHSII